MTSRLGHKVKNVARVGVKVAVGAGIIAGAALGVKGKGEKKFEEKKEEADQLVGAGKVVAGAVQGIAQAGLADVKANPLGAKKAVAKSKQMVVGVGAAAKVDPIGAAQQVQFAVAPKVADPNAPTGKIRAGAAGGTGGGGDIRDCDTKYSGVKNKNQRRKCRTRVKGGGMP